jgi:BMFP domain-containing protein YqiC
MAKLTNNYGDQPDFGRMAQAYQTISSELAKSSNLPALDAGNEIKNAIKALDEKLDMMSTQINARLDGTHQTLAHTNQTLDVITERLGRLEKRQAARWVYVSLNLDIDILTLATM